MTKLLTKAQATRMRANWNGPERDHKPVVKLFHPANAATWLLTELAADEDQAFGLCDLGHGCPELGYVSLSELASLRTGPFRLCVERDRHFEPDKTLTQYADEARMTGGIQA
jgi:hypothetical protein